MLSFQINCPLWAFIVKYCFFKCTQMILKFRIIGNYSLRFQMWVGLVSISVILHNWFLVSPYGLT